MGRRPLQPNFTLTGSFVNASIPESGPVREACISRVEQAWKSLAIPEAHHPEDIENAVTMLSAIAFSDFSSPLSTASRKGRSSVGGCGEYIPPGTRVAAVREVRGNWFLATVVRCCRGEFVVRDDDADDADDGKDCCVPREFVRLLSTIDDVFEMGERVLAVFPDTTTFYPGTVLERKSGKWLIRFDDDTDLEHDDGEGRLVDPCLVLPTRG